MTLGLCEIAIHDINVYSVKHMAMQTCTSCMVWMTAKWGTNHAFYVDAWMPSS